MPTIGELIRAHHDDILTWWTGEARRAAAARGLSGPEFQNGIPEYLWTLAGAGSELGQFSNERRAQVEKHLSARLRQGFELAEIVEEFALLGRCVAMVWSQDGGPAPPHHLEIERLFQELHLTSVGLTELFTRHMLEDEQTEKRYQRLIQSVAREALASGAAGLHRRLPDVLALVMDAMGAHTAALVLCERPGALDVPACVGVAHEELERFVRAMAHSSGREVIPHEETSAEALTTELTVTDALRRSGVGALIGVRLPGHQRCGAMYIGLGDTRAFTAREMRRLESLAVQLTLHLENARLYADLRETIAALTSERELRERFVSMLAHDLRGPLTAAKMTSQLLVRHPERLDERRDLAIRIDRNLERTDRMIRDLLDANRIRAGHRLPLRIDECDLGTVAREMYEELVAAHGERFVLKVEGRVAGYWSADELRRALGNLSANAVKYGDAEKPITIRVKRTARGAQVTVQNWGAPISAEDQMELFHPFSRTHSAQAGSQKGWGLGLTLVHGCAVAHGGRVLVSSSEESGTSFTLDLPSDARPFQPRLDEEPERVGLGQ